MQPKCARVNEDKHYDRIGVSEFQHRQYVLLHRGQIRRQAQEPADLSAKHTQKRNSVRHIFQGSSVHYLFRSLGSQRAYYRVEVHCSTEYT